MKKNIFYLKLTRAIAIMLMFCHSGYTYAQVFIESHPVGMAKGGGIVVYGSDGLSKRVPYEKIKGTPFWNENWVLATLYGGQEKEKWQVKARLNLATGEVHYLDGSGTELAANEGLVKKIVFYKNYDSTIPEAVFLYNYKEINLNRENVNTYVQVMNQGEYELLKLSRRVLASADSLFGTLKRYYFNTEVKYFILHNQQTAPVKKLNRENVLSYIPASSSHADWISQNKIDFRKEEDVLRFLNHYNSIK